MSLGSWRCWRNILRRTWDEYGDDQVSIIASGVAFRVAVAIFPAIAILVWVGVRLIGNQDADGLRQVITSLVPDSTRQLIEQAVKSSVKENPADGNGSYGYLGIAAPLVGLTFMIYTTNTATQALFNALNVIYDREERRSFLRFTLITLAFTAGMLLTVVMLAIGAVVLPSFLAASDLGADGLQYLRWPLLFLGLAYTLALLNRYAPHREKETWPLVTFGNVIAALLILLTTTLFSWFTDRFANFAVTYGSLSTMIAFMVWLWASFWIVLVCAELDSCIEAETGIYAGGRRPRQT